jgi:redox-sensitive bicupin YhaK (pirin superfamily)
MNILIHRADSRMRTRIDWLDSFHSFSFGHHRNPAKMGFGRLRVLNDDIVQPGQGFGTHPHSNMEIISIPLSGTLSHQDSTGTNMSLQVDEVQVMTAGTGILHS